MTQEDKELLLKDLSARLPYGVKFFAYKVLYSDNVIYYDNEKLVGIVADSVISEKENFDINKIRPYLCPMSSMTEEKKEEMHNLLSPEGTAMYENDGIALPINHCGEFVPYEFMNHIIQYLLKNHFDFMGLIPKGLAIEVTEDNDPYKE